MAQEPGRHGRKALGKGRGEEPRGKNGLLAASLIAIILIAAAGLYFIFPQREQALNTTGLTFPTGDVHWHADLEVSICGQVKDIPVPPVTDHSFHTHEDRRIHIESNILMPSQITLGRFFDGLGVKFSGSQIFDKANGDACPDGMPGMVRMLVNGLENNEFRDYVVRNGDRIAIKFE